MATPVCPPGWKCTFTPPKIPFHGPWWEGPWGIAAAILLILTVSILVGLIVFKVIDYRDDRNSRFIAERAQESQRRHELAMTEQKTMQMDIAKDKA